MIRSLWAIFRFAPNIIQSQESPTRYDLAIAWIARRFIPFVLIVHDPTPHSGSDAVSHRRSTKMAQKRLASLILVNGEYCYRDMVRTSDPKIARRVAITRHGVIMTPTPQQVRSPIRNRIIFFGRMEHYKGLSVLLDAIRLLNERQVSFSMMVAGRGEELDLLEPKLKQVPNVIVRNEFLSPRDLIDEIQAARLVVMPYLNATQSGVVAAAFANGRPVVASNVGGLMEVVIDGENGLLAPPGKPEALAAAIAKALLDETLYQRMCDGVVETVRRSMNWEDIGRDLTGIYHALLQAR